MNHFQRLCRRASNDWLLHQLWCDASSILVYQHEAKILSPDDREAKLEHTQTVLKEVARRLEVNPDHFPPKPLSPITSVQDEHESHV